MKRNIFERIERFNQGRDRDLLQLKYQAMRKDAFTFFRGSCHLFYEDWSEDSPLNEAPPVWICGDLHLENFGSYKGDNRLVYFDINDFDEAALAPCTWDLARLLTSCLLASHTLGVNEREALTLCNCFLEAYTSCLSYGNIRTVERATAVGMVRDLLVEVKQRRRKDFLDDRTEFHKNRRYLCIDNKRTRQINQEKRSRIEAFVKTWASTQPNPKFFQLLDIAYRIAGTGSLGLERYVLLIEGKGSPNQNYLLDLKIEPQSSVQPYLKLPQPHWKSESQRVVAVQQRVQSTPPALLTGVVVDGKSYILRELQPIQDRVTLNLWNGRLRRLEKVLITMGKVTAWGQLRSGGRQGSAIADDLIAFAANAPTWHHILLDYAQIYSAQVEADYQEFCLAFDNSNQRAVS